MEGEGGVGGTRRELQRSSRSARVRLLRLGRVPIRLGVDGIVGVRMH